MSDASVKEKRENVSDGHPQSHQGQQTGSSILVDHATQCQNSRVGELSPTCLGLRNLCPCRYGHLQRLVALGKAEAPEEEHEVDRPNPATTSFLPVGT